LETVFLQTTTNGTQANQTVDPVLCSNVCPDVGLLYHRRGRSAGKQILIGTFAPSILAIWLTARFEGRTCLNVLFGRIFRWRVSPWWNVFAVGYIPAIKLAVALVLRAVTGTWPQFGHTPWYLIPVAILISTPFQAGEEIGWRGYALPRLADRFGLAWASVVLGVIWACWHLPQFFIRETDTYGQSFLIFLLQVTALSVAMAWLYARTKGSLLLVMFMHATVNNAKDIVPSALPGSTNILGLTASPVAWLTVTLLWILAGYFLVRFPERIDR